MHRQLSKRQMKAQAVIPAHSCFDCAACAQRHHNNTGCSNIDEVSSLISRWHLLVSVCLSTCLFPCAPLQSAALALNVGQRVQRRRFVRVLHLPSKGRNGQVVSCLCQLYVAMLLPTCSSAQSAGTRAHARNYYRQP